MRSTIVKHELAVGLFVATAIALGAVGLVKRTREKGLLDVRQVSFTVPEGRGLQRGAPVLMKGVQVGEISDVALTKDNQVRVTCNITPRFASHIRTDAAAALLEPPLLGDTKVEIDPGSSQDVAKSGDVLRPVQKGGDMFKRVEEIEGRVTEVLQKVESVADRASTAIDTLQKVADKIERGDGLVGQLINDPKFADDARALLTDLRGITHDIREGEGALALAINDPGFAQDLKGTASDVRKVAAELEKGEGSLGRLLKDPALVDEATGLVKDVRGSLAKLDELNEQAKLSVGKVEALLVTADKTVARIDGLVSSANDVTTELASTLKKINEGEGTIARLLNDDALYRETKSLLKELRESVEDLREQAPINSFLGVVFSAF